MKIQKSELTEIIKYELQQIAEIYIGMDGFIPETAPEKYCLDRLAEMYKETILLQKKLEEYK